MKKAAWLMIFLAVATITLTVAIAKLPAQVLPNGPTLPAPGQELSKGQESEQGDLLMLTEAELEGIVSDAIDAAIDETFKQSEASDEKALAELARVKKEKEAWRVGTIACGSLAFGLLLLEGLRAFIKNQL
jgi:hypothetical protein